MRTTPKLTASRRTRLANPYSAAPPARAAEEARYEVNRSGPNPAMHVTKLCRTLLPRPIHRRPLLTRKPLVDPRRDQIEHLRRDRFVDRRILRWRAGGRRLKEVIQIG